MPDEIDFAIIKKQLELFAKKNHCNDDQSQTDEPYQSYQPYQTDPEQSAIGALTAYAKVHPTFLPSFMAFNKRVTEILNAPDPDPENPRCSSSSSSDDDLPPLPPEPPKPPKKRCCPKFSCVVS